MKFFAVTLIRLYQRVSRSLVGQRFPLIASSGCRSWPTCSEYTIQAIEREGVLKGLFQGVLKISCCNPFLKSR